MDYMETGPNRRLPLRLVSSALARRFHKSMHRAESKQMKEGKMKAQKVVSGLVMRCFLAPSAGFCAKQTHTIVNN
jgi:hypothetical protein